jgi:hypothetical protein
MSAKTSPRRSAARTVETLRYLTRTPAEKAQRNTEQAERTPEAYASKRTARTRYH